MAQSADFPVFLSFSMAPGAMSPFAILPFGDTELVKASDLAAYADAAGNMARTAAEKMSKTLGQQIVSRIGAAPAAGSPPPDRQGTASEIAGIPPISKERQLKCGPPSAPNFTDCLTHPGLASRFGLSGPHNFTV
jgi:hypothetical protein